MCRFEFDDLVPWVCREVLIGRQGLLILSYFLLLPRNIYLAFIYQISIAGEFRKLRSLTIVREIPTTSSLYSPFQMELAHTASKIKI